MPLLAEASVSFCSLQPRVPRSTLPQFTASRKPSLRVQGQGTGSRVHGWGPGAGDRVPPSSEVRLGPCRQGWSWLRPPGRGLDQGGEPPPRSYFCHLVPNSTAQGHMSCSGPRAAGGWGKGTPHIFSSGLQRLPATGGIREPRGIFR